MELSSGCCSDSRNFEHFLIHKIFNFSTPNRNGKASPSPNPPPASQRILVRTCNGLELRDPPYMPADQCLPRPPGPPGANGFRGSKHALATELGDDDEDGVIQFTEIARAKSALSHHSFRSMRSFHDDIPEKYVTFGDLWFMGALCAVT